MDKSVWIVVSELGSGNWHICAKELVYVAMVTVCIGDSTEHTVSSRKGVDKDFIGGFKIGSATCFHARLNPDVTSPDASSVIYLKNTSTGQIYRKLFTGKLLGTMVGNTINITFDNTWSEISEILLILHRLTN